MFSTYFPDAYFAPRYWPPVGAATTTPDTGVSRHTPPRRVTLVQDIHLLATLDLPVLDFHAELRATPGDVRLRARAILPLFATDVEATMRPADMVIRSLLRLDSVDFRGQVNALDRPKRKKGHA